MTSQWTLREWMCSLVTYPVVWNALHTLVGDVFAILLGHTKPGFDHRVVEESDGVLLTMVGHKAVDKGVGGGLDEHSSERAVEKVRVVCDLVVESL